MTMQRRRGSTIVFYPQKLVTDADGVPTLVADMERPSRPTKAWVLPERGQRAEVPGQQVVNHVRIGVRNLPGLGPWARAKLWDRYWDIALPPEDRRNAPRSVRHMVVELRERVE